MLRQDVIDRILRQYVNSGCYIIYSLDRAVYFFIYIFNKYILYIYYYKYIYLDINFVLITITNKYLR